MGNWGMGVMQSDTYCEVYDAFMEEYDQGKPLLAIKQDILEEYLLQFEQADGILHDVYFAIGRAEWMCGGISEDIYAQIDRIVHSGADIAFLQSLGATQRMLNQRQKNLTKFLSTLSVPRGVVRKRKIPEEKYVAQQKPKLPPFRCGDVFAYHADGRYRLLSFISRNRFWAVDASYCYVWTPWYDEIPTLASLTDSPVFPLGYFTVETFPPMEKLRFIGHHPEISKLDFTNPGVLFSKWEPATWALAREGNITEDFPPELCIPLRDCLQRLQSLRGGPQSE